MTKLEYDDFYRFIVSLGVVLMALAFLLPWLFLREPFDALVTVDDMSELTLTAQRLINIRQATALWFVQNITWISGIIAVTGLSFLIVGVFLWARKQRQLDEKESLERRMLELEIQAMTLAIQAMTPTEIAQKAIKEVQESAEVGVAEPLPEALAPASNMLSEYFRIESLVIDKLRTCFSSQVLVLPHQRIDGAAYDVILFSGHLLVTDVIIEIKFTRRKPHRRWILENVDRVVLSTQIYQEKTKRNAAGVVLFIVPRDSLDGVQETEYRQVVSERTESLDKPIFVHFIAEEDLEGLSCKALRVMVLDGKATPK